MRIKITKRLGMALAAFTAAMLASQEKQISGQISGGHVETLAAYKPDGGWDRPPPSGVMTLETKASMGPLSNQVIKLESDGGPEVAPSGGLPTFLRSAPAANQPVYYTGQDPVISAAQSKGLSIAQIREFYAWKLAATGLKPGTNVAPTDLNAPPPSWWIPTYL